MASLIEDRLLQEFGARKRFYAKNAVIYRQGEIPRYYYQIIRGEVKLANTSATHKEFIQRIFTAGQAFGEPPLFGDFGYPANATALTGSSVWVLPKEDFYVLLKEHPDVHFKVTTVIASRFYHKAITAWEMTGLDSKERVKRLLQQLKSDAGASPEKFSYEVELTRKQIGELTGLREETVIRLVKQLEKESEVQIAKRRIRI